MTDETPSGADATKILLVTAFALGLVVVLFVALFLVRWPHREPPMQKAAEDLSRDVEQLLASPTATP